MAEQLRIEWACEICTQALADAAHNKFPKLRRVELGIRADDKPSLNGQFIQITEREVEFEDARRVLVKPFWIRKNPVSICEFEYFTKCTGYVTVAEKESFVGTFRDHSGLSGRRGAALAQASVRFITAVDAEEYCKFTGYRLPTEEEWFAASVLDSNEYEKGGSYRRRLALMRSETSIFVTGSEITSSKSADGRVVTRRGPKYFLQKGWRERAEFERRLIAANETHISLTFRVVQVT